MKIIKLQFLSAAFYVGEQKTSIGLDTHDIERLPGEGFIVKHRQTAAVFFVPYAHAIAQIEPGEESDDAAPPARGPAARRARQAKDAQTLED